MRKPASFTYSYNHPVKKNPFPLFFFVFYVVWIIRATWFYSAVDLSIANETLRLAFSVFVKFVLWMLPAAGFIFWLDWKNPLEKMKVNTPISRNNLTLIIIVSILNFCLCFSF